MISKIVCHFSAQTKNALEIKFFFSTTTTIWHARLILVKNGACLTFYFERYDDIEDDIEISSVISCNNSDYTWKHQIINTLQNYQYICPAYSYSLGFYKQHDDFAK